MAWVRTLPSGRFNGMYRDGAGNRKSAGTFDDEKRALAAAVAAEDDSRQRTPASDVLWRDWEKSWTRGRKVDPATLDRDASRIEKHVMPRWGDLPLSGIKRTDVQKWIDDDLSHLAASTQKKIVTVLSASLTAAIDGGMIEANPASRMNFPAPEPSPERWLSVAETDAIRDVLADQYRNTYDLLLGTGMRWGEAVALHWDHVDVDGKKILVRWNWDRRNGIMKAPKNHQKRTIPLGDTLVDRLGVTLEADGHGEPLRCEYRGGNRPMYGLVLPGAAGGVQNGTSFAHGLAAAGQAAFVGKGGKRRRVGHVRPHDLRHTYASRLVQSGVSLQVVQGLLGHSSVTVTERYAKAAESGWDQVRNVLG